MLNPHDIPLSLYIHFPWCQKKCPYCDFNSHAVQQAIPEQDYIDALLRDLSHHLPEIEGRPVRSLFLGGGTPSLFSPESISLLISRLKDNLTLIDNVEITMEANPGTVEMNQYSLFADAGINRLSIGIQSFNDTHLTALGRIHNSEQAQRAIHTAQLAGFDRINLDLMFGLPQQSISQALDDLHTAIQFQVDHISWYQLTLEPNTYFHRFPPPLPAEDQLWEMQQQGQRQLKQAGYSQYEVSAYCLEHKACQHNLNYWQFGDYLGIGAGAHAKITQADGHILRYANLKHPKLYLQAHHPIQNKRRVQSTEEITFEFMLNALRLKKPLDMALFEQRTGLCAKSLKNKLNELTHRELIEVNQTHIQLTALGERFLNEVITAFL